MTTTSLSKSFRLMERQTILAPLGLRFRDAITGADVSEGLAVTVYPTANPSARTRAFPNRSGAYVLHRAPGLLDATHGAGDDAFWDNLTAKKTFTVEVFDQTRRYLPCTFQADLPARGLLAWVWPLEATSATTLNRPATSFRDNFDDNTRDATRWKFGTLNVPPPTAFDTQVTALEQNGRLEITPRTSQSGKHYNGYLSLATWSATNARVSVEVVQATQGAAETIFTASLDGDNFFRFVVQAGQLLFQSRVDGSDSSANTPYVAAQHRWWSFRHNLVGDEMVFETSADGKTWVRRRVVPREIPLSALTIELGAGTSASVGSPGKAIFDNFVMESNPTPAVPLYSSPSRSAPAGMAVLRAELWNPLAQGGKGAPASYALLEARVVGQRTLRGVADAAGRISIVFPYPEPTGGSGNTPPPAYTSQEWDVNLRAFYAPQSTTPPLPNLNAVLQQPAANLWSDEARSMPLTKQTLRFGQELIVRSKKTTTGAPLDPVPLPVLLITPAP